MTRVARGEVKLLYVAPERFDVGTAAERLRDVGVSLLAIDEAHCISEWGHDFRPSYLRIAQVRERLGWPPTVALTATATPHVRQDIARQLRFENPETIITGFDRQNLRYHVVPTRTDAEKDAALARRPARARRGVAIVYASTRRNVEKIARTLERRGHHGRGVPRRARRRAPARGAGCVHERARARDRRHQRVRHGDRQAERAPGRAPRDARHARGVLPGSRTRGPRRAAGRGASCCTPSPTASRTSSSSRARIPERALVEQVYDACCARLPIARAPCTLEPGADRRRAAGQGQRPRGRVGAAAAHRRRVRCAPIRRAAAACSCACSRRRSASSASSAPSDALELGLLRALWRVAGDALYDGAPIDLDGLPPGFGGVDGRDAAARRSSSAAQFLEWHRARRRRPRHRSASSALGVSARLGGARPTPQGGAVEARRDAAVRVRDRLPSRLRAALLRRSRGGAGLRRVRQLPRHPRRDRDAQKTAPHAEARREATRTQERRPRRRASGGRGARRESGGRAPARAAPRAAHEHRARGAGAGVRRLRRPDAARDRGAPSEDHRTRSARSAAWDR